MDAQRPKAEIEIDEAVVGRLLAEERPDLASLRVERVGEGWDNVTFRLGDGLALRLPRRPPAAELLRNEQRWLPKLAARLSVAVPDPLHIGQPAPSFPFPWSIVPWIHGSPAADEPLAEDQATRVARFLRRLHGPAPDDAPRSSVRGCPLRERTNFIVDRIGAVERAGSPASPTLRRGWQYGLDALPARETTWLHGDLHPHNVLTANGSLAGVIDWGDLCAGDPATDLASAWTLFEGEGTRRSVLDGCLRGRCRSGQPSARVGRVLRVGTRHLRGHVPRGRRPDHYRALARRGGSGPMRSSAEPWSSACVQRG